jgi:hypothetical protein
METNATALTGAPAARRLYGYRLATVLAALMLTLLLEALDQTVVGTATPKIIGSLNGFDRYTWVVTAYLLASVTIIPLSASSPISSAAKASSSLAWCSFSSARR